MRDILQRELDRRRRNNSRYSLRAFAARLGIDHSTLSQILRGRRRLTTPAIRALGRKLRLTTEEIGLCCAVENDAAVLAVIAHPSFRPDSRWIATMAGIRVDEVNISLQRLLYRGALVMQARDLWRIQ